MPWIQFLGLLSSISPTIKNKILKKYTDESNGFWLWEPVFYLVFRRVICAKLITLQFWIDFLKICNYFRGLNSGPEYHNTLASHCWLMTHWITPSRRWVQVCSERKRIIAKIITVALDKLDTIEVIITIHCDQSTNILD